MFGKKFLLAAAVSLPALSLTPAGCGGALPASQNADNSALLSLEVEPLKKVRLRAPDNAWTAAIESAQTPAFALSDDAVTIEAPIGTRTPVVCILYDKAIEPGATITKTFGPTSSKKFTEINIREISAVKDAPVFFVEGYHEKKDPNQKVSTELIKMAVYAHPDKSAVCLHEEMGYRETFLRISRGFFDSLYKRAESRDKPRFVEVWLSRVENIPSAVTRREFYYLADGTRKIIERETSLDKYKPGAMYGDDVLHTTVTDSDNIIISDDFELKRGGYPLVTVTLKSTDDGEKYKFYFKAAGGPPPFSGTFAKDKTNGVYPALQNNITARRKIEELVKNKSSEKVTFNEFHVGGDPQSSQRITYNVEGAKTPARLSVDLGEMKILMTADADGALDSLEMSMPMDAMNPNIVKKVTSNRIFRQGEF